MKAGTAEFSGSIRVHKFSRSARRCVPEPPNFLVRFAPYTDRVSDENQMDGPQDPFGPEGFDASQFFAQHGIDFSQMLGMLSGAGPVNWEVARQVAESICLTDQDGDGGPVDDPDVDPVRAERLANLVRAAQTNVAATTGLAESTALEVQCVNRRGWTTVTLEGLRPVLEALASRMSVPFDKPFDAGAQSFGAQFENPADLEDDP